MFHPPVLLRPRRLHLNLFRIHGHVCPLQYVLRTCILSACVVCNPRRGVYLLPGFQPLPFVIIPYLRPEFLKQLRAFGLPFFSFHHNHKLVTADPVKVLPPENGGDHIRRVLTWILEASISQIICLKVSLMIFCVFNTRRSVFLSSGI